MARQDLALYDSVLSSNLRSDEKSGLRRWFEKAVELDLPKTLRPSRQQLHGGFSAFRQGAESLITGGLLGAINVESPGGLAPGGVHIDAIAGGLLLAGSAIGAESDMAPTARNIGAVCTGVFGMRATQNFLLEKRLSKGQALPKHLQYGSTHSGDVPARADVSKDPIVLAAEGL